MIRRATISQFVAGDPVTLETAVRDPADVLLALGLDPSHRGAWLRAAPGAWLLTALVPRPVTPAIHWVHLSRPALFGTASGGSEPAPTSQVVVVVASLGQSRLALQLIGLLVAAFEEPQVATEFARAGTREALVAALRPLDEGVRETALEGGELLAVVGSGPGGLSAAQAAGRLAALGSNRLQRVHRRPLVWQLLEQFWSFFAIVLWVGGGFAILAGLPELGWAIFAVILINGIFSFFQEYRAERALQALERMLPRQIAVVRDGGEQRLPVLDLVPGDVVRLSEGDQVPADGWLLESTGLRLDQAALTGEPHPVFKFPAARRRIESAPPDEWPERVFAGTGVVAGAGTFVVTATGMGTAIGDIARLTQSVVETRSPLEQEMRRVSRWISVLALGFGLAFFLLGVTSGALPVQQGFLFALGVIVANVPEGLLPTLTLALAIGVQRMARRGSLVRRLSAVETLGATTVICTDKTGTLTENRMALRYVSAGGRTRPADATDGDVEMRALLEAAALASVASAGQGDPTERALVQAAIAQGIEVEALRVARPILRPIPFDSFRRRMTLVRGVPGGSVTHMKGAPRAVLELCAAVLEVGRAVPLDAVRRAALQAEHDRLAAEGMRMLAVAVRARPPGFEAAAAAEIESDLTLLGMVALWDPPRPEVAEAVALCRRAGIRPVMVTGDDGITARAIAHRIGLEVTRVVSGEEIERLPADALGELVAVPGVLFSRATPAHKLAVVEALRARGEVVAVTGDGVNDAPALKAADIGVAMGRRGSDVAREAAEMVITDDNFASIVTAVRLGRSIYANIGKFVRYILASNVPELVPFTVFVLAGVPLPLTVMQILAVDLGTDLIPALALGAEKPEPGLMDRPPRTRHERLLSPARLAHAYGFLGLIEAALALLAFFWTYWVDGWRPGLPMTAEGELYRRATTMTLSGIVACQVGNVFACRTERESVFRAGLLGNRLVLVGIASEIGLLLLLMLVPPLAGVFGLEPLRAREWLPLLAFPPLILLLEEGRKALLRRRRPRIPATTPNAPRSG